MGQNSKIEWTDATWNPIEGCSMAKGSENGGCLNCYAARTALRRPAAGLAVMRESGPRWTGKVQLVEKRLDAPLHWTKPQRIFVNSMSDLFHESLPDEVIDRVFAVMALCPQHTFQVLTKRPERMREYLKEAPLVEGFPGYVEFSGALASVHAAMVNQFDSTPPRALNNAARIMEKRYPAGDGFIRCWPLPNVWLGVSIENQATADVRIPRLLQTPANVRFVSYEPALGPVDLTAMTRQLDWVIAGGESGPGARPPHPDWFLSVRDQCVDAGVPFFFKQWGEWLPGMQDGALIEGEQIVNSSDDAQRVGKKKAGALLDGHEWKQFPGAARP